jgi:hypothetical protein
MASNEHRAWTAKQREGRQMTPITALIWFIAGFLVAIPFVTIFIASYGDSELNTQIHHLRKQRLKLSRMKFELALKQFVYKAGDKGYVVKISTSKPHQGTKGNE